MEMRLEFCSNQVRILVRGQRRLENCPELAVPRKSAGQGGEKEVRIRLEFVRIRLEF